MRDGLKAHVRQRLLRSLLEKAVRRGHPKLVITICACLADSGEAQTDQRWLTRFMTAAIFQTCWPLGRQIHVTRKYHSKVALLVRLAGSAKNQDADGLGALAQAYAQGDRSALDGTREDGAVKIVASGLKRPPDFFAWALGKAVAEENRRLIEQALKYHDAANTGGRAAMIAAAYLATAQSLPAIGQIPPNDNRMDYWLALESDRPPAQWAYGMLAKELHMPVRQLAWTAYFEAAAKCPGIQAAPWWERYRRWQCARVGLSADELHLLWEPVRPQLVDYLKPVSDQLHQTLYEWKISHLDRIQQLANEVSLFLDHDYEMQAGQGRLFDAPAVPAPHAKE